MEEEKDIRELMITWYEGVLTMSNRITTGNLAHQKASLKGYLSRISVYIAKHYSDNELAMKHSEIFASLAEKCDYLTTGNLSHNIAIIRSVARNYVSIFQDYIKYNLYENK